MDLAALSFLIFTVAVAAPVRAESALERVLTMIADNPDLAGGTVFINLASHAPVTDGSDMVDSTVQYLQPQGVIGQPLAPQALQIETMALGATNTGLIRVLTSTTTETGDAVAPLNAANAATTQSPIRAPIFLLGDGPVSDGSTLSTKAIGAMNTGQVLVSVQSGGDE